jgi:hypothetical protein
VEAKRAKSRAVVTRSEAIMLRQISEFSPQKMGLGLSPNHISKNPFRHRVCSEAVYFYKQGIAQPVKGFEAWALSIEKCNNKTEIENHPHLLSILTPKREMFCRHNFCCALLSTTRVLPTVTPVRLTNCPA